MFTSLRSKRFWKRLAISLGVLAAILLIVNALFALRTERRLQAKLAGIRAAGHPASIAELAPDPIPDEENAAVILARVAPQLKAFSKDHSGFNTGPGGASYADVETQRVPPTAEQIETVRQILAKYPEIDDALAKASASNQYASQRDFSVDASAFLEATLEGVQDIRSIGRFVPWRMRVLVADGEADQAVLRGIELLQFARLYESEPGLVHYVVSIAMRGIATDALYDALTAGAIPPELHAQLDEELARHDDPQRLVRALRLDRAIGADFAASAGLNSASSQRHYFLMRVLGWPIKSQYIGVLDAWDSLLPVVALPRYEVHDQLDLSSTGHGVLADMMIPLLQVASQTNARDLAVLRALRIFNALVRYREQEGHDASGLDDLPLPREATIDPFSGQPLKLKLTDNGWVIYSVFENGGDDGGDFTDQRDYGLAPRGWRADPQAIDEPARDQ